MLFQSMGLFYKLNFDCLNFVFLCIFAPKLTYLIKLFMGLYLMFHPTKGLIALYLIDFVIGVILSIFFAQTPTKIQEAIYFSQDYLFMKTQDLVEV